MAHTKAKGTTKLGRDSASKRLGVKIFGGSKVKCGQIIIRQRGTKFLPGEGVKIGRDDTLYAVSDGIVLFRQTRRKSFNGNKKIKQVVSVIENEKLNIKNQNDKSKLKKNESESKTEIMAKEKLNINEEKEVQQAKPEKEMIREQELPKIPARRDVKKESKSKK
jgi:large subunit ribosomal protein L27